MWVPRTFPPLRKINSLIFHYRTQRWRWNRAFRDGPEVIPHRPIYLLGTQNGGLTLLARILHRHPDAVSATGDHRHWAGEDELQDALRDILPEDFGWRRVTLPGFPSDSHGWLYATPDFLPHYRRTAAQADPAVAARYRAILGRVLRMNAGERASRARFVDKSQTLTLRVGQMQASLPDSPPVFVMLSRNPYAMVWSQAQKNGTVRALDLPIERKVELCAWHWRNSHEAALEDAAADPAIRLRHWRFEDLLADPAMVLKEICAFCDLRWNPAILPGPTDRLPWGSRSDALNRRKWYPLRPDVNARALAELPDWALRVIEDICSPLAARLGYDGRTERCLQC
mgnify:FL=1